MSVITSQSISEPVRVCFMCYAVISPPQLFTILEVASGGLVCTTHLPLGTRFSAHTSCLGRQFNESCERRACKDRLVLPPPSVPNTVPVDYGTSESTSILTPVSV